MKGYHGRFLEIDLNTRTTKDLPLTEDFCKKYIGGATMAAALIYDRVSPDLDPLSPENPMVTATAYRLTMGMGEPVNGPVAMTIGFSGDSGSRSGDTRS